MPAAGFDVDLLVIGGGSGGVRAARIAASYGARVMLAEEFRMGGTCVIRGCVPKKLYVMASRFARDFADARGFGWNIGPVQHDWQALVAAKEREITRLEALYAKGQRDAGVEVVASRAVLEGPQVVRLLADGRLIRARHILLATGGTPQSHAEIPGHEAALSSNEIFDLPTFPKHLVVMGGGYIALEFASLFRLLGAQVTLIHRGEAVLRGFDADLQSGLLEALQAAGIRFLLSDTITRIEQTSAGMRKVFTREGAELEADAVLFATGRVANTVGLGLEEAGVTLDSRGFIAVDAASQTTCPSIYAVGDVNGRAALTPVAIREGHAFADSVFGGKPSQVDHTLMPTALFTTPEIGTVGLSEEQARARYTVVDLYRTRFRPMRATLAGSEDRMMMKVLVDGQTDRVLGVHLLGEGAGEMIQLLGITLHMGATKADFDATLAVHPTAAEELVTLRTRTARFERA